MTASVEGLRSALSIARQALEFYAKPYGRKDDDGDPMPVPDFYSELDFGSTAEVALKYMADHGA